MVTLVMIALTRKLNVDAIGQWTLLWHGYYLPRYLLLHAPQI